MMMDALSSGGLTPIVSQRREDQMREIEDEHFRGNEGGYFEPDFAQVQLFMSGCNMMRYDDRLMKLLLLAPRHLPRNPFGYRIIIMEREPEEIVESFDATFNASRDARFPERKANLCIDNYRYVIKAITQKFGEHPDVESCTRVSYDAVLTRPGYSFERLRSSGWPIDVEFAMQKIKPKRRRSYAQTA